MNRTSIVTDLTRFNRPDEVCTAGIDLNNGECLRPMPYLLASRCQELNVLPGAILNGDFTVSNTRNGPHQEDYAHSNLMFHGPCTTEEFKKALECGLYGSVQEGFEISLEPDQKHIPPDHHCGRSIITVCCHPKDINVARNPFDLRKIRLNFKDQSGKKFKDISITDLGFHNHALRHNEMDDLLALNEWIHGQDEVFLRVGLSRVWTNSYNITGYWIQANGIYTFPEYHEDIRSYA